MTTQNSVPGNQPGDLNQLEKDLREAVTMTANTGAPAGNEGSTAKPSEPAVPEKFKGKTFEDVVSMYTDLHSQYGRMANDLGTQRKLTDRLLDLKRETDLANNGAPALPQIKSDELLDRPAEAIDRVVEARLARERTALNDRLGQLEATLAQERFVGKHPDYQQVASSAEFVDWVKQSAVRTRAAAAAAQGDYSVADELISEYKTSRSGSSTRSNNGAGDKLDEARRASLEGSSAGDGKASQGKVYRRADLIRLKIEKPQVYSDPQFQAEIMKAYAEGRVR